MLAERLRHHYVDAGRNCAEALLLAADDTYHLGVTPEEVALLGGFGGGMGCGDVCGALAAAVGVIGRRLIRTDAHDTPGLADATGTLVRRFREDLGSTRCDQLKDRYKKPDVRCLEVVLKAGELLDAFVRERR